jgi:hypothetical protein
VGYTIATAESSTVIGKYNVADGTGASDPKHLFIIGNGTGSDNRSNILEVSDTYLNLNGIFKQNGQAIDFSTLGDEIVEMSDIEYDALVTKDPDKVYFVYETEENSGTITPKPNGFKRIYKGDELYATNELPDITPHVELTQSQYDALQNPDPNTEYFITNADASGDFSSIEDRMTAIEDEYTIVYMDGNVRIPLYTRNVYKVVRVDGNTVEWYIAEPTSQRNFKATVTATGSAGTRTNPTVTVTEVV